MHDVVADVEGDQGQTRRPKDTPPLVEGRGELGLAQVDDAVNYPAASDVTLPSRGAPRPEDFRKTSFASHFLAKALLV